ncbi:MAG: hypothetical protein AAGL24_03895 [Pseudomonadota bacterium]
MFAKLLFKSSQFFNVLFVLSGTSSLAAYIVLYFIVLGPFTWFIWIFSGLPVLILLFWAPPLFFVLVVYWLVSRPFLFFPHWGRRTIGILLTILLLYTVPLWVRSDFDARGQQLVSGDIMDKPEPVRPETLALVSAARSDAKLGPSTLCEDFCQRVLLNGVAKGIALFWTSSLRETPKMTMRGKLYRLEQKKDCPEITLSRAQWIGKKGEAHDERSKGHLLLEAMADEGRCVVSEEITLSQADVVIAAGLARRGLDNSEAGFNLFADTINVKRIQLFVRKDGVLKETYRVTDVTARLPIAPLILAFNMDEVVYGIRWIPGFLRSEMRLAQSTSTSLSQFLTETLQLNLELTEFENP